MIGSRDRGERRPALCVFCQVAYGVGHWMRTAALLVALRDRFAVTLILGGRFDPELFVPDGVDVVQLPAKIRDHENQIVGLDASRTMTELNRARVSVLRELVFRVKPAVVLVEYFPFGRPEIKQEVQCLVEYAKYPLLGPRTTRPLILCSLRDIHQQTRPYQELFDAGVLALLHIWFDGILVHADPKVVRFEETFAPADLLRVPVHYTGYVVFNAPTRLEPEPDTEPTILVSVGGGLGGETLLRTAVEAQRVTDLSVDYRMLLITGVFQPEHIRNGIDEAAKRVRRIRVVEWVPSLRDALARATVSVSRCGYNTAMDLARVTTPALVVPYSMPGEDEQTNRARRFERLGQLRVLEEKDATPETLAREIRLTVGVQRPRVDIDLGGAERSAELIMELLQRRTADFARNHGAGGPGA